MNELTVKLEQVSKDLSLQQIGIILSVVQTVLYVVLALLKIVNPDRLHVINYVFIATGIICIILSGAIKMTLYQIFMGFNEFRKIFPYYFLDILAGLAIGFLVTLIITQIPSIPCVYNYIKNKS